MTARQRGRDLYRQAEQTQQAGHWPAALLLFQMAASQFAAARATAEQARTLHHMARLGWLAPLSCDPVDTLQEAARLYEELGDTARHVAVLVDLARYLCQNGAELPAQAAVRQARALLTAPEHAALDAALWRGQGHHALQHENLAEAEGCFLHAAMLSKAAGDLLGQAHSVAALAQLALLQGRTAHAQTMLRQAHALAQDETTAAEQPRRAFIQRLIASLLRAGGLATEATALDSTAQAQLQGHDERLAVLYL